MNINNRQNIQAKLEELELLEKIEFSFKKMGSYDCIIINDVNLRDTRHYITVDRNQQISRRFVDVLKNEIEKMKLEIKEELEKL